MSTLVPFPSARPQVAHSAGRSCTRSLNGLFRCCGHALTLARASERASATAECICAGTRPHLRRDSPTSAPGLARVSVRLAALLRRSMLRQSGLRAAVTAAQQYEARGAVLHRLAAPASKLAPRPLQQFKSRASSTAYRSIARRRRTRDNPILRFRWILRGVCCYVRYSGYVTMLAGRVDSGVFSLMWRRCSHCERRWPRHTSRGANMVGGSWSRRVRMR